MTKRSYVLSYIFSDILLGKIQSKDFFAEVQYRFFQSVNFELRIRVKTCRLADINVDVIVFG